MSSSRRSYKDTRRWILDRARMEEDANEISSWLLTASVRHPRSFERLLGSYRLLCERKSVVNAADDLGKLYLLYSHDSRVWTEVTKVVRSLQSLEKKDVRSVFYRAVFESMNAEVQPVMYLDYVERCSSRKERSDALMIFLRFMEARKLKISVHWQSLLGSYIKQCFKDCNAGVTLEYLPTLLIFTKVLPILTKSRVVLVPENDAVSIFQYAAYYFIDDLQKKIPRLSLPLNIDVSENEVSLSLQSLRSCYQLLALRYRWSSKYFTVRLSGSLEQSSWTPPSIRVKSAAEKRCYAMMSFVYWIFIAAGSCEPSRTAAFFVLVPPVMVDVDFTASPVVWFTFSALSTMHSILQLAHALMTLYDTDGGSKAVESAVQFIRNHTLRNIFVSGLMFAGKGHSYLTMVSSGIDFDKSDRWTTPELFRAVQIACHHFALSMFKEAGNFLLHCLTSRSMRNLQAKPFGTFDFRWSAIPLSEKNVFSYAVRMLIYCLINVSVHRCDDNKIDMYDSLVGHMLVMMQLEWTVWSMFARQLMKGLVKRKRFHFPKFHRYVYCPMLIEMLCDSVLNCEDADVLLFEKRDESKRQKQDTKTELYKNIQSTTMKLSDVVKDFFYKENMCISDCNILFFSFNRIKHRSIIEVEIEECHCIVPVLQSTFPTSSNCRFAPKSRTNCPIPKSAKSAAILGHGRAAISTHTGPPPPILHIRGTIPSRRPARSLCTGRQATPAPDVCGSTTTYRRRCTVRVCDRDGRPTVSADPRRRTKRQPKRPFPSAVRRLCTAFRPDPSGPFATVGRTCDPDSSIVVGHLKSAFDQQRFGSELSQRDRLLVKVQIAELRSCEIQRRRGQIQRGRLGIQRRRRRVRFQTFRLLVHAVSRGAVFHLESQMAEQHVVISVVGRLVGPGHFFQQADERLFGRTEIAIAQFGTETSVDHSAHQ
ncbi:Integrator complex subunit 10, partial [Trichinella spiralis]